MKNFKLSIFSLFLFTFSFLLSTVLAQTGIEKNPIDTGPKTTVITLTIEVPNEYLETQSILEAATIYGIDAKVFAQRISERYLNKFQVNELDDIADLQKNNGINIQDVKEIAQSLQSLYPAPPQQKETLVAVIKEEKILNQREFVFRSVVVILCLYFISYFLTYRELMHHNIHKRARNTLLLISFIGYGIIILSYLIPSIYSINIKLGLDIIYHNLRIGFIIIFLGFSHALRYLIHYRQIKRKLHHKIPSHVSTHHKEIHKTSHKTSHPSHTTTKIKKVK